MVVHAESMTWQNYKSTVVVIQLKDVKITKIHLQLQVFNEV